MKLNKSIIVGKWFFYTICYVVYYCLYKTIDSEIYFIYVFHLMFGTWVHKIKTIKIHLNTRKIKKKYFRLYYFCYFPSFDPKQQKNKNITTEKLSTIKIFVFIYFSLEKTQQYYISYIVCLYIHLCMIVYRWSTHFNKMLFIFLCVLHL